MKNIKLNNLIKDFDESSAAIIESSANIKYFTDLDFEIENGVLFVLKNKKYLLVDDRFFGAVKKTAEIETIRLVDLKKQLKDLIQNIKIKEIFLETGYINLNRYKTYLEIFDKSKIDLSNFLDEKIFRLRAQKTAHEIKKIKEAQGISDEGFDYIINYIKPGVSERQIATELERQLLFLGSEGKSFDFIVVSGQRSAIPHGKPSEKKIERGDFVTLDFGVKVDGYCSDMTRTVVVGEADDQQKEIYNIVLGAQELAIKNIKPGVSAKELDKIAREYIKSFGYEKFFVHALGHGVGLNIHEYPRLSPRSDDIIKSGSVLTIEPGIYIPEKFGVRIEDLILVKDIGFENLTRSSKNLILL
ncbi:MAG: aminopeptidase P family protein [Oscillospiraceae bacterium]|nr:aminopeptidase P family protein [Oscillospiraceae bacterium]